MSDQLPANPLADYATEVAKHRQPQSRVEGGFLMFNGKTGAWSFGQQEEAVDGALVLINATTMEHGWIRWGDSSPVKALSALNQPYPEKPEPFEGTDDEGRPKTYTAQQYRQVRGAFWGEDDDLGQFVFNTNSMGGVENIDALFDAIIEKSKTGPYVFPVVQLESESYKRSTGKVYKPVFKIVEWRDINGNLPVDDQQLLQEPETEDEAPPEEEEPVRRRRRRAG